MWANSGSGEGPLPGLHLLAVILTLLLIRAAIPFKRAPPSRPNYLPKIPPPDTIPLGNENSTNIRSVAPLHWVATRLHEVSLLVRDKCGEKFWKVLGIFAWGWHKWRHLHAMSFKALNPSQATLTHKESLIFHLYWCYTVKIRRSDSDVESSQIPQNSKSASGSNERVSLLLPKTWTAACIPSSFCLIGSILCWKGPYECPCGHSSHPALYSSHEYPIFGHGSLGVEIGTSALPSALWEHGPRKCLGKEFGDPSTQRWSLYEQVSLAQRPCPIRRSSTKRAEWGSLTRRAHCKHSSCQIYGRFCNSDCWLFNNVQAVWLVSSPSIPQMGYMNHCTHSVVIFSASLAFIGKSETDLEDLVRTPFLSFMFGGRVG